MHGICFGVLRCIHELIHDVIDSEHIAVESSTINLTNTEPEMCIVIVMAIVDSKDAKKLQHIAHESLGGAMQECYGLPVKARKTN